MRAVDINPKGNVIRVYLTNREDLSEVWGDDWDDQGCTDTVYSKYVDGYKDIIFNFHTEVFNCEDYIDGYNARACKEDMKKTLREYGRTFISVMHKNNNGKLSDAYKNELTI